MIPMNTYKNRSKNILTKTRKFPALLFQMKKLYLTARLHHIFYKGQTKLPRSEKEIGNEINILECKYRLEES